MKRGKPLPRRTPLRADPSATRDWQQRSRKPLPAKSTKQRAIDAQRPAVRAAVVARDGNRCWVKAAGIATGVRCASPSYDRALLELHEVVKRSRWRLGVLDPSNCRLLCQAHHDWTEAEAELATAAGLLASRP